MALGLLSEVSAATSQNFHGCLPFLTRYGCVLSIRQGSKGQAIFNSRESSNPRAFEGRSSRLG